MYLRLTYRESKAGAIQVRSPTSTLTPETASARTAARDLRQIPSVTKALLLSVFMFHFFAIVVLLTPGINKRLPVKAYKAYANSPEQLEIIRLLKALGLVAPPGKV